MEQAEANAGDYTPVLFFKRNKSPVYACIPAEALIGLYTQRARTTAAVVEHVKQELSL